MFVLKIINNIFSLYLCLILLRILLSWIPNINWYQQPAKFIREVTDIYLDIFRRFIPPIGGLDFSPIIAIIVLQILQGIITDIITSLVGYGHM